jgi:hypothetical protein
VPDAREVDGGLGCGIAAAYTDREEEKEKAGHGRRGRI